MSELKVNTDRLRLQPGKDVRPHVLDAAKAKWPAGILTCSELVAWIRSDPRHSESGTWLFGLKDPRSGTPEEIARNLIDEQYFVAAA